MPSFFEDQGKDYIIEAKVYRVLTLFLLTGIEEDQAAENRYTIEAVCYSFSFG